MRVPPSRGKTTLLTSHRPTPLVSFGPAIITNLRVVSKKYFYEPNNEVLEIPKLPIPCRVGECGKIIKKIYLISSKFVQNKKNHSREIINVNMC